MTNNTRSYLAGESFGNGGQGQPLNFSGGNSGNAGAIFILENIGA